jgi:4-hydroxy-tetrahydrodipicolinate synthase
MVTPFLASGTPDVERAAAHAKSLVENGCDGVTLFGTTGEGYGISKAERHDIQKAVRAALPADATLCVGILSSDIDGAVDQALSAYEDGATHLLMSPPFFMKNVTDDGLFNWYSEVFSRIGAPLKNVILYHIPGQTQTPLSSALVTRLREAFPQVICGVKDSSGDWATAQTFLSDHGDIAILIGDERLLPKAMAKGAQGSICGTANFMPKRLNQIIHQGANDDVVIKIVDAVVSNPVNAAVKTLTAHVKNDPVFTQMRAPLVELDADAAQSLIAQFDSLIGSNR